MNQEEDEFLCTCSQDIQFFSNQTFSLPTQLPDSLYKFLQENSIPLDAYNIKKLYRFIRVNPQNPITADELKAQFKDSLTPVEWMPYFYQLPVNTPIASTPAYRDGRIFGMDVSSAAVVMALDPEPSDHVLDLCCAPGAKLCMIGSVMTEKWFQQSQLSSSSSSSTFTLSELSESSQSLSSSSQLTTQNSFISSQKQSVEDKQQQLYSSSSKRLSTEQLNRNNKEKNESIFAGSITGVDISLSRLNVTKRLVQKYQIPNVRLFVHDATTFNILAPHSHTTQSSPLSSLSHECPVPSSPSTSFSSSSSLTKKRRISKKKHANDLPNLIFCNNWRMKSSSSSLYDKVLLDAQCTLDASVRHILHYNKLGWSEFDPHIPQQVTQLQRQLLANAFRLVKEGGVVVYSTCSFCKSQNEEIVTWLLNKEPTAVLVPIEFESLRQWYKSKGSVIPSHLTPAEEGTLPHTLRFYPKHTGTSGMFIAKIMKQTHK